MQVPALRLQVRMKRQGPFAKCIARADALSELRNNAYMFDFGGTNSESSTPESR